jgi:signal peptidase I
VAEAMSDPIWAPPPSTASDQPRRLLLATAATLGAFVALGIVCSVLAYAFVLRAYYIPSGSMEPTLRIGTYVLDNRLAYTTHEPARGDIVILHESRQFLPSAPDNASQLKFVKRVVAVGGDVIKCCDNQNRVLVNGRAVTEGFTTGHNLPIREQRVPAHSVFVLGDHRDQSVDSRVYGPVPASRIDGRVVGPRGTLARLAPWATGAYAGLLLTAVGWVAILLSRRRTPT